MTPLWGVKLAPLEDDSLKITVLWEASALTTAQPLLP